MVNIWLIIQNGWSWWVLRMVNHPNMDGFLLVMGGTPSSLDSLQWTILLVWLKGKWWEKTHGKWWENDGTPPDDEGLVVWLPSNFYVSTQLGISWNPNWRTRFYFLTGWNHQPVDHWIGLREHVHHVHPTSHGKTPWEEQSIAAILVDSC